MKVRRARRADLSALADLACEFEQHLAAIEGKKRKRNPAKHRAALARALFTKPAFSNCLVAEEHGGAQAYLLYHFGYSGTFLTPALFISDLFVRKSARRLGLGRALMNEAIRLARKRGCGRIEWTVWNINAEAIGFYVRLGAKPLDDEMILGLDLSK